MKNDFYDQISSEMGSDSSSSDQEVDFQFQTPRIFRDRINFDFESEEYFEERYRIPENLTAQILEGI